MTREQVDKIARGRIWSGEDAKGLGHDFRTDAVAMNVVAMPVTG